MYTSTTAQNEILLDSVSGVFILGVTHMSIRVLLADDHALVRHSIAQVLQQEPDIEIVGQVADGHAAVAQAREILPDLILMDVSMPDLNGVEATRIIADQCPDTKVLALSMHARDNLIHEMFKAGAKGYVLKDCEFDELTQAIRAVAKGQVYISPAIASVVVDNYIHPAATVEATVFSLLTPREREILQLLAEGKSTKQIGLQLHISPKTVEVHRLNIMAKLHLDNVAQLTKYAVQEGLTSPEP